MTPTRTPTPTATPVPAKATSTKLYVYPTTVEAGHPVVLIAVVSPYQATGKVQFKNGTSNIGAAQNTFFGFALQVTSFQKGTYQLSAVFTPNNAAAYKPSTSDSVTVRVTH